MQRQEHGWARRSRIDDFIPRSVHSRRRALEQIHAIDWEEHTPEETLEFALEYFGRKIAMATAFGLEGMVLLDMIAKRWPNTQVFWVDTQLFFPETYELIERAQERWDLDWIRVLPGESPDEQSLRLGRDLFRSDSDACCQNRKVEPLRAFLRDRGLDAWITSLRRGQSASRANTPIAHVDPVFGLIKFNPLARWSSEQVHDYIREHDVPTNVLHERGYPSVGCRPCTRAVIPGQDERSGRWAGSCKTECGLHRGNG